MRTTPGRLDTSLPVDTIFNCFIGGSAKSSVDDLTFSQGDVSVRAAFTLRDIESYPGYDVKICPLKLGIFQKRQFGISSLYSLEYKSTYQSII